MQHEPISPYVHAPCRIAEALVAGREAGRTPGATAIDCPFSPDGSGEERRAWLRGFAVGRVIDSDGE